MSDLLFYIDLMTSLEYCFRARTRVLLLIPVMVAICR